MKGNKMMKKFLTICMAVAMIFALAVNVFAVESPIEIDAEKLGEEQSVPVTVTIKSYTESPVYSVDVAWEGLVFTYHENNPGTWKPNDHTYEGKTAAHWEANEDGTVSIENHSNVPVSMSITYVQEDAQIALSISKSDEKTTLNAGTVNQPENPDEVVYTYSIDQENSSAPTVQNGGTIGTIKITITAVP